MHDMAGIYSDKDNMYKPDDDEAKMLEENKMRHVMYTLRKQGHSYDTIALQFDRKPEQVMTCLNWYCQENDLPHPDKIAQSETSTCEVETSPPILQRITRIDLIEEMRRITLKDRNVTYGDFHANMKTQGEIMSILTSIGLHRYSPAHNACIEYVVGKLVRMAQGQFHRDNYVDIGNYIVQAWESQEKFEKGVY